MPLKFIYQLQESGGATLSVSYDSYVETGWNNGEGTGIALPTFQTSDMEVFLDFLFERQEDWMIKVVIRKYL